MPLRFQGLSPLAVNDRLHPCTWLRATMADLFDINLARASTAEFLRQGFRFSRLPQLWWYRFRGFIWLLEQGLPVEPHLDFIPPDQIPETIAGPMRIAWQPVAADFLEFRFVGVTGVAVESALGAIGLARDGRALCQITRVGNGAKSWASANFTSRLGAGLPLVTGNARYYWDPPADQVRTIHLPGRSIDHVWSKHRQWLAQPRTSEILCYQEEDVLPSVQRMSRALTDSYIRRGLYIVRS
jgi:hypothetical protein